MNIMLDSLTDFHEGGEKFTLPSKLVKYIEFEKTVVFLLDENGRRDKIIGVKFITSMEGGGVNHYYIDWEFQIIDGRGRVYRFDYMQRKNYKGQEVIVCSSGSFMRGYYLSPDTGEIVDTFWEK